MYHSAETRKLVEMNYELTKKMNPGVNFYWILVDDTPLGFDSKDKMPEDGRFLIIPGPEGGLEKMYAKYQSWITSALFLHNTAINIAFKNVKTRFAISLDSDFYILEKDWIKKATDHMEKSDLTFLGTPWHPKDFSKFRYFPCHQCLFADFQKLKEAGYTADDIDFTPPGNGKTLGNLPKNKFGKLSRLVNISNFSIRRRIGQEKHTAHKMFENFYKNPKIKTEIIPAVFKPEKESYPALNLIYIFNKFFEFFLPDKFCYIPKDKSYYTTISFKEMGYNDVFGEEFVWQEKPFGTHVRLQKKLKRDFSQEYIVSKLNEIFKYFI